MNHLAVFVRAGIALLLLFINITITAQGVLNRRISIDAVNQPLPYVLEQLSNRGNFYFSYNSNIIPRDSIVSLIAYDKSVRQILEQLFRNKYTFTENSNYIILRRMLVQGSIITGTQSKEKLYTITGSVINAYTGERMGEVSVYEKDRLISTMTNEQGKFEIKLKSRYQSASLTVSKSAFTDTVITVQPRFNQEILIAIVPEETLASIVTISPVDFENTNSIMIPAKDSIAFAHLFLNRGKVERTAAGKLLLSTRQKIQSINLRRFFAQRPFQVSLVPGMGTQGSIGSQVTNKLSFNILGGYTGGVKAFELGGLFNINKKDVRGGQIAGLLNVTGGTVHGFQLGGINNTVLDNVKGFQIAGISNYVQGKFGGFQIGGIYNHNTDSVKGVQIGGIGNFARKYMYGVQVSGIINVATRETEGLQLSGIFNYTKKLKGVQIGLINICDTSEGYSVGLLNIVFKGYHKVDLYNSEVLDINAAFKTGNRKLYSILMLGSTPKKDKKVYSFGYGLGREFLLNKWLTLNPELTSQYMYRGSWEYFNQLNRLTIHLHVNFGKYFSLFAGPSLSIYYSKQNTAFEGYAPTILPDNYNIYNIGSDVKGWFGWNAGISLF